MVEDFAPHFGHIFPAMLKLATDVDGFARKLFEPLTRQVILLARAHVMRTLMVIAVARDGSRHYTWKRIHAMLPQVIHWLTANQTGNELMLAMLEAIMQAVADPLQSGVREFGEQRE